MKINKPLVSVIMPAHNAQLYAAKAIESVLEQSFKEFELIVINDFSTDRTISIVKKYARLDSRIRIVNNRKKLQIARSLNKGIKLAKADIVARMDADDISHPERLKLQYAVLTSRAKVAIVGADIKIIDLKGKTYSKREYPIYSRELKNIMFRYSPFAHPAVMFKKAVFEEFGGYDFNMVPCEDIDLWFKIGSRYEFASVSKPLLKYRLILTSNSHKKLKPLELLGFKIKIKAIRDYGYTPSVYDLFYNFGQFATLWFMPASLRIWLYNFLRSRRLI